MKTIISVHTTLGAMEIGATISVFLLGAVTVQVYIYHRKFASDNWRIKLLVAVVWLLELAHAICTCYGIYSYTILRYGQPIENVIGALPIGTQIAALLSVPVAPLVQAFYAYRIRKFSGTSYVALICWVLCFSEFICGVWAAAGTFIPRLFDPIAYDTKYKVVITILAFCGVTVDWTITVSMCYLLAKCRDTVVRRTIQTIDNLIAWTIQTGLITSMTSVSFGICFLVMPENMVWLAIYLSLERLHSNSLLALLNARVSHKSRQAIAIDSNGNTIQFSMPWVVSPFTPALISNIPSHPTPSDYDGV